VPDRTLLLDLDLALGRSRSHARNEALDRLERERDEFFDAVREGYLELWRRNPAVIRRLDAARPADEVLDSALDELSDLL
jgi:dTMP kinase